VIEADPGPARQVVVNLAVKRAPANASGRQSLFWKLGPVTIDEAYADQRQALRQENIYSSRKATAAPAWTEAHLSRIFEPFSPPKRVARETGLGLATVYALSSRWGTHPGLPVNRDKGRRLRSIFPPRITKWARIQKLRRRRFGRVIRHGRHDPAGGKTTKFYGCLTRHLVQETRVYA